MTRITDGEIIDAFIENQQPANSVVVRAIIDHFGRESFVRQATLVAVKGWHDINGVYANQHNFCQNADRIQFYKTHHHDFMAGINELSNGKKEWFLSMMLGSEADDAEIHNAIILNDVKDENYNRLADFFMIHEIEGLCQTFYKFMKEYKETNQFLDININLDENITVDAKRLLLNKIPTLHVMKDGSVRDNNGVFHTPHKTLEDILDLIRASGYKDGYAAANTEGCDD